TTLGIDRVPDIVRRDDALQFSFVVENHDLRGVAEREMCCGIKFGLWSSWPCREVADVIAAIFAASQLFERALLQILGECLSRPARRGRRERAATRCPCIAAIEAGILVPADRHHVARQARLLADTLQRRVEYTLPHLRMAGVNFDVSALQHLDDYVA